MNEEDEIPVENELDNNFAESEIEMTFQDDAFDQSEQNETAEDDAHFQDDILVDNELEDIENA